MELIMFPRARSCNISRKATQKPGMWLLSWIIIILIFSLSLNFPRCASLRLRRQSEAQSPVGARDTTLLRGGAGGLVGGELGGFRGPAPRGAGSGVAGNGCDASCQSCFWMEGFPSYVGAPPQKI